METSTPLMALRAPWPTPSLRLLASEETLTSMKMSFSPSAQKKVSVLTWTLACLRCWAAPLSLCVLLQATSCSWWPPMSSDTPWACPTPAILVRSCSPSTPTATQTPSSCPRTTSGASSLSTVRVRLRDRGWSFVQTAQLFLSWIQTLTLTCSGPNPEGPLGPGPEPPTTPDACDSKLVLDAVTTLRGEIYFFKGR